MKYQEIKKDVEERVSNFPIKYAFSETALNEGLKALGIKKDDAVSVGYGGFIRKSDLEAYREMWREINGRHERLVAEDDEYVSSMFEYEMGNHEYCITYDDAEILSACGLKDDALLSERMCKLYEAAREKYLKTVIY